MGVVRLFSRESKQCAYKPAGTYREHLNVIRCPARNVPFTDIDDCLKSVGIVGTNRHATRGTYQARFNTICCLKVHVTA